VCVGPGYGVVAVEEGPVALFLSGGWFEGVNGRRDERPRLWCRRRLLLRCGSLRRVVPLYICH
jgi:hypothetical protein